MGTGKINIFVFILLNYLTFLMPYFERYIFFTEMQGLPRKVAQYKYEYDGYILSLFSLEEIEKKYINIRGTF